MIKINNLLKTAFNNILYNKKNIIIWKRNLGKTKLVIYYINNFINYHNDKDILCISKNERMSLYLFNHIADFINDKIIKLKKKYINCINNNYITFNTYNNYEYDLYVKKPELIILEDITIYDIVNLRSLLNYIENNYCKIIITSSTYNYKVINYFDYNNDFYINIVPTTNQIKKELLYKPKKLLELNIFIERKEKIKKINEKFFFFKIKTMIEDIKDIKTKPKNKSVGEEFIEWAEKYWALKKNMNKLLIRNSLKSCF